jgi:hypothetical protein
MTMLSPIDLMSLGDQEEDMYEGEEGDDLGEELGV